MNNSEDQGSSSSSCSSYYEDQPHVLAVDDNVVDRKLIEKLLKTSSCKGYFSFYLFLLLTSSFSF